MKNEYHNTLLDSAARIVRRHYCSIRKQQTSKLMRNSHRDQSAFNHDPMISFSRNTNFARMLILLSALATNLIFADVGASMRKGNQLYRQEKYEDAFQKYQEALVQEPDNPKIHYNIARALYKMEKYDEAISEFEMGLLEKDKLFQSKVLYNVGNCQFRKGQLDAAIESYKMSLLTNHKDMDAKQNLEFCLRLKEQLQNQTQSDSTKQQENQKEQQAEQQPELQTQPKKGEISPEEAERILQALQSEEKENLEKVKQPERKERVDKDW